MGHSKSQLARSAAALRIGQLAEAALAPATGPDTSGRIIDLAVGSPDLQPPASVVDVLARTARLPGQHGYGASRGIPELRAAIVDRYRVQRSVSLDPEREAMLVLGAKEGFAHLIWATVDPGDCVLVPDPSYPVHDAMVRAAGGVVQGYSIGPGYDLAASILDAAERAPRPPRVLVVSLPHNPTTAVAGTEVLRRIVELARAGGMLIVHDFAYADFGPAGHRPPSILEVPGGAAQAVELYSLSKSYSMAGWRLGFALGNAEALAALGKLKPYLDNGAFLPLQHAAIHALTELADHPDTVSAVYESRVRAFCGELTAKGWPIALPAGGMYVWASLPTGWAEGSQAFADMLASDAGVLAVAGSAFGPAGEGYVRFALVQPLQRVIEAAATIGAALAQRGLAA